MKSPRWAETVEKWEVSRLKPFAKNARTHSAAQIEELGRSISEFGFTNPILARGDGTVIAGHGRLLAAKGLGWEEVPVLVLEHLTEDQARAYVIADNRLAQNAGWDEELLRAEVEGLAEIGFDVSLLGFTEAELEALGGMPEVEEDEVPEEPPMVAKPGDVWLAGPHRICCGDATDLAAVKAAMGDEMPLLMVTDPPYGVEYDPAWRAEAGVNNNKGKMGQVQNDDRVDWSDAWRLFEGDVAYVYHAGKYASGVQSSLESCGFETRAQIIWAKDRMALSRGDYHWQHEPCWYCVREGRPSRRTPDRSQTTLWEIPSREDDGHGHGTQKPVECMARPMRNHGKKGDAVYDPFLGSGTSVIAAEQLGRVCVGVELNPSYVDVAVRRWEQFTGGKARLEATGEAFDG